MTRRAALLLLAGGLAGCSASSGGDEGRTDPALLGKRWTLERVERSDGSAFEPAQDEENQYFVRFGADDDLDAQVACNACSATYEAGTQALSIAALACTEMACDPPAPFVDYRGYLMRATRYEVGDDRLRLYAEEREGGGRAVLHHRAE